MLTYSLNVLYGYGYGRSGSTRSPCLYLQEFIENSKKQQTLYSVKGCCFFFSLNSYNSIMPNILSIGRNRHHRNVESCAHMYWMLHTYVWLKQLYSRTQISILDYGVYLVVIAVSVCCVFFSLFFAAFCFFVYIFIFYVFLGKVNLVF